MIVTERGFAVGAVHGDLGQGAREQALRAGPVARMEPRRITETLPMNDFVTYVFSLSGLLRIPLVDTVGQGAAPTVLSALSFASGAV